MTDAGSTICIGLGIDAGGTATRWHLLDANERTRATGSAAPLTGHVYSEQAKAHATSTIVEIAGAVRAHAQPTAVVAGITGLDEGTDAAAFFTNAIARSFGLPPSRVRIENDMRIAYRAACEPGTGVLVYSGTGSVACHVTRSGEQIRVGGRGVIIDDGGSGFWIAKEAVKVLFRAEDRAPGSGWSTPLGQELAKGFGGATWDHARVFIYSGERGRVASLAPNVAAAALRGDATALVIIDAAGAELATLAASLIARLGAREAILAGGTTHIHPALPAAFAAHLPPGTPHRHAKLDPARAAARAAAHDK